MEGQCQVDELPEASWGERKNIENGLDQFLDLPCGMTCTLGEFLMYFFFSLLNEKQDNGLLSDPGNTKKLGSNMCLKGAFSWAEPELWWAQMHRGRIMEGFWVSASGR